MTAKDILTSGGIAMKILAIDELPKCYALGLARDLVENEALNKYFEDCMRVYAYQSQLGALFQWVVNPVSEQLMKRVMESIEQELEKKRGRDMACKDCDLKGGCFISAVLLIADESKWIK